MRFTVNLPWIVHNTFTYARAPAYLQVRVYLSIKFHKWQSSFIMTNLHNKLQVLFNTPHKSLQLYVMTEKIYLSQLSNPSSRALTSVVWSTTLQDYSVQRPPPNWPTSDPSLQTWKMSSFPQGSDEIIISTQMFLLSFLKEWTDSGIRVLLCYNRTFEDHLILIKAIHLNPKFLQNYGLRTWIKLNSNNETAKILQISNSSG